MPTLHRQKVTATAVQGEMSLDGSHYGWTLERAYTDPEHACIPVGTYPLSIGWSAHFPCDMVHVGNVPGRAGIPIHGGPPDADPEHAGRPGGTEPRASGGAEQGQGDMVHVGNGPGRAVSRIHGGNHVAD